MTDYINVDSVTEKHLEEVLMTQIIGTEVI